MLLVFILTFAFGNIISLRHKTGTVSKCEHPDSHIVNLPSRVFILCRDLFEVIGFLVVKEIGEATGSILRGFGFGLLWRLERLEVITKGVGWSSEMGNDDGIVRRNMERDRC